MAHVYRYSLVVKGGLDSANAALLDHGITTYQKAAVLHGELALSTQTVFVIHSQIPLEKTLIEWFGSDPGSFSPGFGFPVGSLLMWHTLTAEEEKEIAEPINDRDSCDRGDA
jgi:hypothetical protein